MASRTIQSDSQSFYYTGHQMTGATSDENFTLTWDKNGQMTKLPDDSVTTELVWNWDGKLRSATKGGTTINLKYDPMGNRIYKNSSEAGAHKYIVDIVGDLPVILMVLDDSQNVLKKYIYANSQIVAQHDVNDNNKLYFYLHDRLGSVRQLINTSGNVVRLYTYNPFGETLETNGSFANPFRFSGQFFDDEIDEYYLRARQYDPYIYRFTSRDPVQGKFEEPLTLHKYLYCGNNPINCTDPRGLWTVHVMLSGMLSFGPSLMYQRGFVVDEYGNVGQTITSNDPHFIEGIGDWGLGLGTPAVSGGVAFGWTSADTILDLEGAGITIGGSLTVIPPFFGVGVDYLQGIQRSGEYYYGFEVVPQAGVSATGLWEVHGQATWTTVIPRESNQQGGLDIMRESVENAIFDVQTVGQAYALLSAWAYLQ